MAVKIVDPNKKAVAICGDGGSMMNSQELETAVRMGMNLVAILLSDNGYGMIKWKQAAMGLSNWGLDYGNPDFIKYAESYRAHGHRMETTAEFAPLFSRCLEEERVHLIDMPMDYPLNSKFLDENWVCLL